MDAEKHWHRRTNKMLWHLWPARDWPVKSNAQIIAGVASSAASTIGLRTHTEAQDPQGTRSVGLTAVEAAFFRENGFIVKRALIPASALRPHIDRIMSVLKAKQPGVYSTSHGWVDPHKSSAWAPTVGSLTADGRPTARNYPMTFSPEGDWRWHGLGSEPEFLDATSRTESVLHVVEALIGGPLRRPTRNRGIYCLFPKTSELLPTLNPHHDYHPFDLGGLIYLR